MIKLKFYFLISLFTLGFAIRSYAESLPIDIPNKSNQLELDESSGQKNIGNTVEQLFIKVIGGNSLPRELEIIQIDNDFNKPDFFLIERESQNVIVAILYSELEKKWVASQDSDNSSPQHPDFIWSPGGLSKPNKNFKAAAFPFSRLQALVDGLLNNKNKANECLSCF